MAGTLPLVRVSAQALYPVTRRLEFSTDIALAANYTEKRSRLRPPLSRFVFPYTQIPASEMTGIRNFVESQKGSFDSTWSVTLGSTTYNDLALEDDVFEAIEQAGFPHYYQFGLKARQTKNSAFTTGSSGGTFPTFGPGATTQLPYSQIRRYAVTKNVNPYCGLQYTWTWFGGGLTGFPTGALHGWQLSFPVLPDDDLATLETFYRNQWGRFGTFSFTEPDSPNTTYTKCRFESDVFEVVHQQKNVNAVTVRILETN